MAPAASEDAFRHTKLNFKDVCIFGVRPRLEDLCVVTCSVCGKTIKFQYLVSHMKELHKEVMTNSSRAPEYSVSNGDLSLSFRNSYFYSSPKQDCDSSSIANNYASPRTWSWKRLKDEEEEEEDAPSCSSSSSKRQKVEVKEEGPFPYGIQSVQTDIYDSNDSSGHDGDDDGGGDSHSPSSDNSGKSSSLSPPQEQPLDMSQCLWGGGRASPPVITTREADSCSKASTFMNNDHQLCGDDTAAEAAPSSFLDEESGESQRGDDDDDDNEDDDEEDEDEDEDDDEEEDDEEGASDDYDDGKDDDESYDGEANSRPNGEVYYDEEEQNNLPFLGVEKESSATSACSSSSSAEDSLPKNVTGQGDNDNIVVMPYLLLQRPDALYSTSPQTSLNRLLHLEGELVSTINCSRDFRRALEGTLPLEIERRRRNGEEEEEEDEDSLSSEESEDYIHQLSKLTNPGDAVGNDRLGSFTRDKCLRLGVNGESGMLPETEVNSVTSTELQASASLPSKPLTDFELNRCLFQKFVYCGPQPPASWTEQMDSSASNLWTTALTESSHISESDILPLKCDSPRPPLSWTEQTDSSASNLWTTASTESSHIFDLYIPPSKCDSFLPPEHGNSLTTPVVGQTCHVPIVDVRGKRSRTVLPPPPVFGVFSDVPTDQRTPAPEVVDHKKDHTLNVQQQPQHVVNHDKSFKGGTSSVPNGFKKHPCGLDNGRCWSPIGALLPVNGKYIGSGDSPQSSEDSPDRDGGANSQNPVIMQNSTNGGAAGLPKKNQRRKNNQVNGRVRKHNSPSGKGGTPPPGVRRNVRRPRETDASHSSHH